MKLLWWKIYFWLNVALLAIAVIGEFSYPSSNIGFFIADVTIYSVALAGVYSYIFKKPLFESRFWKYFFWFNIVYTAISLLYALFPDDPYLKYLSFLNYTNQKDLVASSVISILLSVPTFNAMYRLSKGQFLEPKTKAQEKKEMSMPWNMVQIALWGYSIVFIAIIMLLSLVPTQGSTNASGSSPDITQTMIIFSPILIFWLWVVWEYKRYKWNWWRITLVLNSVLFSGLIVAGSFFYDSTAVVESTADADYIGLLQFIIILAGLIVFGRDQFLVKKK